MLVPYMGPIRSEHKPASVVTSPTSGYWRRIYVVKIFTLCCKLPDYSRRAFFDTLGVDQGAPYKPIRSASCDVGLSGAGLLP